MPPSGKRDAKRDALRKRSILHPHPDKVSDPLFAADGFFDARDLLQVKYEMLRRVRVDGRPIAEAARSFGLSRPTLYEAQAAFARAGIVGLLPAKRGPRGAHKLDQPVIDFAREQLARDPDLTAATLAERIREHFGLTVHPRSVERALARAEKKTR